ncbi:hypothetical protein [Petrocella sp. FN5]|uniref:hypothetical protein n=1 Tax=Petrocella sp. FN5 TaxID=3032002 RepID=UPI0023DBB15E|nr:hypothetical protein [Petrocella sp. FN5]MDF1617389.1 hypothetical protein [Petrocella sp. FN5]
MKKILLILVMCCFIVLSGCMSKKINLMDYTDVVYKGVDTRGYAELVIQWNGLQDTINGDGETIIDYLREYELLRTISYKLDKEEDLSNGDIIKVTVEWDPEVTKKYGVKFVGKEKEIKVEGLKEAIAVDLFEEVHLEYSGVAPEASLTIRNASSDAFLKTVEYTADHTRDLSNGDVVKVSTRLLEKKAMDLGYLIEEREKEYEVTGVDAYITEYSEIDKASLDAMEAQALDLIDARLATKHDYNRMMYPNRIFSSADINTVNVIEKVLQNTYLCVLKKGMPKSYNDVNNSIFMVYRITLTDEDLVSPTTIFIPIYYKDIILRSNYKIDVNIAQGKILSTHDREFDNVYRSIVTANKDKYFIEEINH